MPALLRKPCLLVAFALLGACDFWIIPIPIPLGTTTQPAVPADEPRDAAPANQATAGS
jgi:hypothetical protein